MNSHKSSEAAQEGLVSSLSAMASTQAINRHAGRPDSDPGPAEQSSRPRRGWILRPLTIREILAWADEYHRLTGRWPRHDSEPVGLPIGETWRAVQAALVQGHRG